MSTTVLVITNRLHRDLRKALEATAVRAVVVETLTQTFRLLRRGGYRAVIIDVDRTALDPLELVLNVRDLDARVPILLFGMHGDPINRQVLRRQGQLDFVTSPDAGRLVRRMAALAAC